jgi:hypothetical protein
LFIVCLSEALGEFVLEDVIEFDPEFEFELESKLITFLDLRWKFESLPDADPNANPEPE